MECVSLLSTELIVKQVRHNGEIKPRGERISVSQVLVTSALGPKPLDNDTWEGHYSFHMLGDSDQRTNKISPANG